MKKIAVLPLFLLCAGFTFNTKFTELEIKICDYISRVADPFTGKHHLLRDDCMWTAEEEAVPGRDRRYKAHLVEGVTYVYFAVSDGPVIQPCYDPNLDKGSRRRDKNWNWKCARAGVNTAVFFKVNKTGQYLLRIKTISGKEGKHVGYLMYFYYPGQVKLRGQDEFEELDEL